LAFELEQVQLADAARRPQVGRQADLGEGPAFEIERQALDRAGAEVPAGDDAIGRNTSKRLDHGRGSLSGGTRVAVVRYTPAGRERQRGDRIDYVRWTRTRGPV